MKRDLVDRIGYYLGHMDEVDEIETMFSEGELKILTNVRQFESMRETKESEEIEEENRLFHRLEREKEISFLLKENFLKHIDFLLLQGTVEAWSEILIWYHYVESKEMLHRFEEFHILKIFLNIYMEELKRFCADGSQICVLNFKSIDEVKAVYYKTIFLLRRLEYEIEPQTEIWQSICELKVSSVFVEVIINNAKIHDKNKVRLILKELSDKNAGGCY